MSRESWLQQKNWFDQTVGNLERDPSIERFWIVSHHPCLAVETLSERFFITRKGELWASGHIHHFNRRVVSGKCLITFGGGGGPPHGPKRHENFGYLLGFPNRSSDSLQHQLFQVII